MGTAMALSILSNKSLEDVAMESPHTVKFFQIQFFTDRQMVTWLLKRAKHAGYKAIVLTVDSPCRGKHKCRTNFRVPEHLQFGNLVAFQEEKGFKTNKELLTYCDESGDRSVDWTKLDWLRSITSLPVVVKGILTAEDARLAVHHGAQGIVVSNHGGRLLDGVPATIEVLPEIVEAVQGTGVEVYLDGGVRQGTDVLKALALGARAVFVGRPVIWGLTYKGEQGVITALKMLKDELKVAMTLAGCASLKDITPSLVTKQSFSHL